MAPIPQPDDDRQPPNDHQQFDVDDIETPNFVINVASESSESDDDNDDINGYQLLPQELRENDDSNDDDVGVDGCEDASVHIEDTFPPNTEVETSKAHINPGLLHKSKNENLPYCSSQNVESYMQVPNLSLPNKQDLLWNQERCGQVSSMNQDHVEKIKSAMANFQLPLGHIPEWAKNVSEDQWKKNVIMKVQDKLSISSKHHSS